MPRPSGGAYFPDPDEMVQFFRSGSTLLDLALGGGWAERRVINVVGDTSTGKTLLMIEAAANFTRKYADGRVRYRETEQAFDKRYAAALGMPLDHVDFGEPVDTVEDIYEELEYRTQHAEHPELFIIDSLDALSTRAERRRGIDEASYGGDKAKKMSELFRRINGSMARRNITFMIVSQVRDKIGARFGRKTTRSGGRALDFYASQIVYLAQIKRLVTTRKSIKRVTGVRIKAKIDKNKVGTAYLEAEFPIRFGYGIDDTQACKEWLASIKCKERGDLQALVGQQWNKIEESFKPKEKKYG
jgi:recombination protein RecA